MNPRAGPGTIGDAVEVTTAVNRRELQRYLARVGDRWPIDTAVLGGARVDDEQGAPPQRERGPEFVVILVSHAFEFADDGECIQSLVEVVWMIFQVVFNQLVRVYIDFIQKFIFFKIHIQ